jgi:F-type H+-transporting ATPase subunit b
MLLAVLALLPAARRATAQQEHPVPPSHVHTVTNPVKNPDATETPKSEDSQEQGFLNAPVVHKLAHTLNLSEPAARRLFLAINFLIIFLAIVIPLTRMMPKILRKRSQTLRHSLEEARKASEEARQRMSAVEAKLAGLDREIAAFRQQVEHESREDEVRIKASIQEESERILAAAEQEISAAAAHARRSLRHFAADLAIEQASSHLQLTPENDRALIGEFIDQVAGQAGNGTGGKK